MIDSVKYVFRGLKSVPIYDPQNKVYTVLVEDEFVDIPEELFHKLFKQQESAEEKSVAEQAIVPKGSMELIKWMAKDGMRDYKEKIKLALRYAVDDLLSMGFSKDLIMYVYETVLKASHLSDEIIKEQLELMSTIIDEEINNGK